MHKYYLRSEEFRYIHIKEENYYMITIRIKTENYFKGLKNFFELSKSRNANTWSFRLICSTSSSHKKIMAIVLQNYILPLLVSFCVRF